MSESAAAAPVPQQLNAIVEEAKRSGMKVVDQLKNGKLEVPELLFVNTVYLGAFAVIALLVPDLVTLIYGGDGGTHEYSDDWVQAGAVSNLGLAAVSFFAGMWHKQNRDASSVKDVLKAFFFFYALDAVANFWIVMYGSLSDLSFINLLIDCALAYFHFQHSDVASLFKKHQ
jgi:hypothetical protein